MSVQLQADPTSVLLQAAPESVLLQAAPLPAFDITRMSQRENSLQANVKAGPAPYQGPGNGRW